MSRHRKKKELVCPLVVWGVTHDHGGRKHEISTTIEGKDNAYQAMARYVGSRSDSVLWIGEGISGLLPGGKYIEIIYGPDKKHGEIDENTVFYEDFLA